MRLRKIKNAREKLEEFSSLVVNTPEKFKGKWNKKFDNNNDIHLEIGMGKGKFITTHAMQNKNINYIGIEVSDTMVLKAAREIDSLGLKNLKLLNLDASRLTEVFSSKSISKIFLNFSDPWPKPRHAKRRLTSDSFLNIYKDILITDGTIEMKTDNRNLFEYSLIKFNEFNFKFLKINLNLHGIDSGSNSSENSTEIITTEYEDKFKSLRNIIYYVEVKK